MPGARAMAVVLDATEGGGLTPALSWEGTPMPGEVPVGWRDPVRFSRRWTTATPAPRMSESAEKRSTMRPLPFLLLAISMLFASVSALAHDALGTAGGDAGCPAVVDVSPTALDGNCGMGALTEASCALGMACPGFAAIPPAPDRVPMDYGNATPYRHSNTAFQSRIPALEPRPPRA